MLGTFHIAALYIILFLVLAYLIDSGKLKKFIQKPTVFHISKKKSMKVFYAVSGAGFASLAFILYIALVGLGGFWPYAVLMFFVLPICLAFFWSMKLFRQGETSLKIFAVAVIAFSFIGLAGSNLHDFFWCCDVTHGFTQTTYGGGDLSLWSYIFQVEPAYNTFGIYMLIQAALFCCCGLTLLYYQFKETGNFNRLLLMSIVYAVIIGALLYVIDMPLRFHNIALTGAYTGIPVLASTLPFI
jgi:hypothetical protein